MLYNFTAKMKCIGAGCVEANSIEEAKEKIMNEEYEDIYDMTDFEILDVIEINEGED